MKVHILADASVKVERANNGKRRHSHVGYLSPRDFEKMMAMEKVA